MRLPLAALELGVSESFFPGEEERVEACLDRLDELGVTRLRTVLSWADWWEDGSRSWYDWLLPTLAERVEVLPCFVCTPPSYAEVAHVASPPREPGVFADFLSVVIDRLGRCFEWVELWNEPNNPVAWDPLYDPGFEKFAATLSAASRVARHGGKKTVLGGMSPIDPNWLWRMFEHGAMHYIDVVGVHGYPGTYEVRWDGWGEEVARVQRVLDEKGSRARIWITEAGFSTVGHDDYGQVRALSDLLEAPVERAYWHSLHDLDPSRPSPQGLHVDERDYHLGLSTSRREPKLLHRLWRDYGLEGVREAASWPQVYLTRPASEGRALLTGGAGFVGVNLAERLASAGRRVRIVDNLSRPGVERNLRYLQRRFPGRIEFEGGDIRDRHTLDRAVRGADVVYHLAAQPAAPVSIRDPLLDFQVNLEGTMNLLEALRALDDPPGLVFTSSSRVYGALEESEVEKVDGRWLPRDPAIRAHGIDENRPLDGRTPFCCSKIGADKYVLDYARTLGQRNVALRVSSVYGPRQQGSEDQGWIAHAVLRTLEGEPVRFFGDGCALQDALFVDDLVTALLLAEEHLEELAGQPYNVGGGVGHALTLAELVGVLEELHGPLAEPVSAPRRAGDPLYYVSDSRRFAAATGWQPDVGVREGVIRFYEWLLESRRSAEPRRAVLAL